MNIKDYAVAVLGMNNTKKRLQAIANLQHGLKHEALWNDQHKKEIAILISFLQSSSDNINDLEKFYPTN